MANAEYKRENITSYPAETWGSYEPNLPVHDLPILPHIGLISGVIQPCTADRVSKLMTTNNKTDM